MSLYCGSQKRIQMRETAHIPPHHFLEIPLKRDTKKHIYAKRSHQKYNKNVFSVALKTNTVVSSRICTRLHYMQKKKPSEPNLFLNYTVYIKKFHQILLLLQ